MPSFVNVAIHASQFPAQVRRDLLESLRLRQINHKFLYDSLKQTEKWLALHQAYSPSRTDPDCTATYDRGFTAAAARMTSKPVHLLSLGCGGGQKDARVLRLLRDSGCEAFYTPADVSAAMVLTACEAAQAVVPGTSCAPLVCDLASADDLPTVLEELATGRSRGEASPADIEAGRPAGSLSGPLSNPLSNSNTFDKGGDKDFDKGFQCHPKSVASEPSPPRLISFFGMLPNFEPQLILARLAGLVRSGDYLLLSANLAPGPDYAAGIQRILPLYDNAPTRDWLMTFLLDLGLEREDGELRFVIEGDPGGSALKRVAAYFHFSHPCDIRLEEQQFEFRAGESIRLFFSYRHTPALVTALLEPHGLRVVDQWVTRSEEEGVFLVSRA